MLSQQQENRYIQTIPSDVDGEERRAAYAVISGFRDQKSKAQIAAYYSLSTDLVDKWYTFFNFKDDGKNTSTGKGSKKTNALFDYVVNNVGKLVTPKELSSELNISLPTFYNFYNANRHFFKKVKRGEFEIVSPEENRKNNL